MNRIRRTLTVLTRGFDRKSCTVAGVGLILAALLLSAVAQAAFTDSAVVAADVETRFELAVLDESSTIVRLSREPGSALAYTSTAGLVPGATLKIPLALANNSAGHSTRPQLTLTATGHDHAAGLGSLLRARVVEEHDGTDTVLLGESDGSGVDSRRGVDLRRPVTVDSSRLAPRSGTAQAIGDRFDGGDSARSAYSIFIELVDDPLLRRFDGADWTITITIEGTSG